jgi:hypothetical protein
MLGSNQRPLPCEGSEMVCWRFLELAKCLQIGALGLGPFSQPFRVFTRVAARLLHTGGPTPAARHGSSSAVRARRRCTPSSARIGRVTSRQPHRTRSRTGLNRHPGADSLTQRRGRWILGNPYPRSCIAGGPIRPQIAHSPGPARNPKPYMLCCRVKMRVLARRLLCYAQTLAHHMTMPPARPRRRDLCGRC